MLLLAGLFCMGIVAGAMNAVAGGGSFVSFPTLVFAGLPPVVANASSTVALFPGGLSSAWAFRNDLKPVFVGVRMWLLGLVSAIGGLAGAILLLSTPAKTFDAVIPWILLLATLTFAFGHRLGAGLRSRLAAGPAVILAIQFVLGIYGGYFGGAVGIMMMAVWSVITQADVKLMTQHRSVLVNAANAIAVVCFIVSGKVAWPATVATLAGAIIGGYGGARVARRLDRAVIRAIVIAVSAVVTAGFFTRLL